MNVRIAISLVSITLLFAAGKTQFSELKSPELVRLVRGAEIVSGDKSSITEIFEMDGSYRRITSDVSDRGRYSIEDNSICILGIRRFCRAIVRDNDGNYYYVNRIGVLRRPYRIHLERKQGK